MAVQKYKIIMKYPINIKGKTNKQVTKLNLSGLELKEFPENVFDYPNLTKLVLSNNRIKVIPKVILKLKKLKVMDLANNEISVLQGAVFRLPKLQTLNLYGNKIKKFPKQIMDSSVQKLIVSKNPIEEGELERLKEKCEVVFTSKNQETTPEAATVASEVSTKSDVEEVTVTKTVTKEDKKMEKKHSIFISYSHEDNLWLTKVLKNLKPLQRYYDNVDSWSDKKIMASDVWKDEIDKALKKATIAILLISSDFEASDFITNEELQPLLDKAQADGTKIMPLIVRPCAFFEECGLSKYQAVNDPKKPLSGMTEYEQEMALVDMVKTIKEIIKRPVESKRMEASDNYVKGTEVSEEEVRGIVKNWRPE